MKKGTATTQVTMREFRAAPAKILRRAARAKTRLRIGDFVLSVEEAKTPESDAPLYGCMRDSTTLLGTPDDLLSTGDRWKMDE